MNLFIRKKAYNLLDRYDVLDDTGRLAYTADGFLSRLKGHLTMRDRAGVELLSIHKSFNPLFANYSIEPVDTGTHGATLRQQFRMRPTFLLDTGREQLTLRGNLHACDFEFLMDGEVRARIRKRNLRWGETYVLSVADMQAAPIYCAIVVALDNALFHNR
ncbi:MAG: hypothetical protein E7458_04295 [Ruminococcaceae bacterium]|nr:hypothetical protein [Oscillospiraceae bacterium]